MARPRLFSLLEQASRRPVIWVEGPAGSGKTTLAASWLARWGGKTLWYQVDARDRDPATFFYYLREAVGFAAARRREPLPLLTPECLADLEAYARTFFDGVFERLGSGAVLVLDDYQELPADAALQGILAAVLAAIPEGAHVLVLSRTGPPPALARLRANSLMATLGWEALRFTSGEASELLAEHGLLPAGSVALEDLHEEVDGWAAGLVLLGEAARRGERREAAGARRPPDELFEYFASQVFDRAEPALQRVLLATAPLTTVSAAVAERLAGEGAGARLERLARGGFFTTRRDDGAAVYQYHPLFRAFLQARAEAALSPGERGALLCQAAELLDQAGQPEEALGLLQEAGAGAAAAALVVRLAPALAAQGRLQTVEGWIRALPEDAREASPWLLHWLGVCRQLTDPRESLAIEERAFAGFQALGDDAGSLAAWTGAMQALYFAWDDPAAEPWLRWLDGRMRRVPGFPTPDLAADVTASVTYHLLWSAPSHPELPAWAARLAEIVEVLEDPAARARALPAIVWYRDWTGDRGALEPAVRELERACRAAGVPAGTRIRGLEFCAVSAGFMGRDPGRAVALATEALRAAETTGNHASDLWMNAVAAIAMLSGRDAPAAEPYLEVLRRRAGANPVADCYGGLADSWQALLLGERDRAADSAQRALDAAGRARGTLLRTLVTYHLAQVHRLRGDAAAATRYLAIAEETAVAGRGVPFVWACRLMRAQLALDAGERDAGRKLLAEALAEGRERGFNGVPFSSTAHALAGVCEEALDAGIEVDYVRRLIRLHDLAPDPSRAGTEEWPFEVRVTVLGRFALQRADGRAWGAGRSKPLDLLKALVVLGGREVAEQRLVEMLWPEADEDRGRQRLKYTLHALRQLLAEESVLTLEKGLLSLDQRRVWVDAWELERQLARLAAAVKDGREDEASRAIGRALAMHRGPLLEGEQAPWAIAARDRLEVRLRRLIVRAVELGGVDRVAPVPTLECACELYPGEPALQRALARARSRRRAVTSRGDS